MTSLLDPPSTQAQQPAPTQEPTSRQRPTLTHRALAVLAPLRDAEVPPAPAPRRTPWEVRALALLCLVVYAAVGFWLRHDLHFAVGDALARTANAKYMLFARDAHAAALGFVWMPIPTVSQLPFVALLEPFGQAADAGWVTTAIWGAGTVLVLGRLARDSGVRRPLGLLLVAAYALNPVVVYYAANGMSEGPLFFFLALSFLGLFRHLRRGDSAALVTTGVGLLGCALDRYEAIPLVVGVGVVVLVADLRRKGRHAALTSTALVVLPGLVGVALWFLYMRVIRGTFHAFTEDAAGSYVAGGAPAGGPAGPAPAYTLYRDVANGMDWLHYTLHWCLAFAPGLVLLPLLLLARPRRACGGVALVMVAVWLPAVTAYLLRFGGSAGDPRYFTSVLVTTAVGVVVLVGRVRRTWLQAVVTLGMVGVLGLGWVTAADAQVDRASTGQEGEWRVFEVLHGSVDRSDTRGIEADAAFARRFDALLEPGDVAMLDVRFTFEVELYSRKPGQFIINNDRDYDAVRADPYLPGLRIDYLVFPGPGVRGAGADYAQVTYEKSPDQWTRVDLPTTTGLLVYRRTSQHPVAVDQANSPQG